ncbi:MAG: L-aspartate oxidase [Deltaproteobacteria bacterium]|jgi:L-aspartate oxidase|nr:L-aspartate oxidase [Deltaproteobacteria bacterium]MBW2413986.1 L-aspartate oxidase [Deltaproteobacteria bacterium]
MRARSDFLVLGSGIAGLSFALRAAESGPVVVVTKKGSAESATNYAQGGIAAVTSPEDSFEDHVRDTLVAGAGLCHEDVVRFVIERGPAAVRRLVDLGVRFDRAERPGGYDLGREGGHSQRRVLHAADFTGKEIEQVLLERVERHPSIRVLPNWLGVDLVTTERLGLPGPPRIAGAYVLDAESGEVSTFEAPVVLLATGGCGKVYLYTSNPEIASGDGIAMAYRAGATISNMEFIQFHPTCLYHPDARSFLISEAVRGEGAVLRRADGVAFMREHDERADLAPRDVVARAIDFELKRSGDDCVYLDCTAMDPGFIRGRFPNISATCASFGIDMAKQPVPVVPAAHYSCGGVRTDKAGETSIANLFAAGEVTCTGLHGANRLASNSLLEGVVFAEAAAERAAQRFAEGIEPSPAIPDWDPAGAADPTEAVLVNANWDEIRRLMWNYVGIVRTDKRLARATRRIEMLQREIGTYYWDFKLTPDLVELRNLATVAELIVRSASARRESRGLHYTPDHAEMTAEAVDTDLVRDAPPGG